MRSTPVMGYTVWHASAGNRWRLLASFTKNRGALARHHFLGMQPRRHPDDFSCVPAFAPSSETLGGIAWKIEEGRTGGRGEGKFIIHSRDCRPRRCQQSCAAGAERGAFVRVRLLLASGSSHAAFYDELDCSAVTRKTRCQIVNDSSPFSSSSPPAALCTAPIPSTRAPTISSPPGPPLAVPPLSRLPQAATCTLPFNADRERIWASPRATWSSWQGSDTRKCAGGRGNRQSE